ncbi:MAG: IS1096 element passenger TnpR family protein [Bacteroidota bacterium]
MFIYRFRINFEEQEGFSRDIELRTDQTFLDFHHAISENLSLDKSLECAFFLCDHRFRKKKQIYQHKPSSSKEQPAGEENPQQTRLYMEDCVLSDYIDDPHQKFLYVYDPSKEWTFFIELLRIKSSSEKESYPKIVASEGAIPREISRKPVPLPGVATDEEEEEDEETQDSIMSEEEGEYDDEEGYSEEDMDELDESGFYDDSIQIGEDFDEGKS